MAVTLFSNPYVYIGSSEISTYCNSAQLDFGADALEVTAFGATTKTNVAGLKQWSMTIQGHVDWTDNLIDEILAALVGTSTTIKLRAAQGTITASNPEYTGTCIVTGYNITGGVSGTPGFTLSVVSGGALTRSVT